MSLVYGHLKVKGLGASFIPLAYPRQRLVTAPDFSFKLGLFHLPQDLLEYRAGRKSHRDEISATKQGLRMDLFLFELGQFSLAKIVVLEITVGGEPSERRGGEEILGRAEAGSRKECPRPDRGGLRVAQM